MDKIVSGGYQRTFGRRFISDLSMRHSGVSVDADYSEIARTKANSATASMTGQVPNVELSLGGFQKTGPLALSFRDHMAGFGRGAWTTPGVIGVYFQDTMKNGHIAAWKEITSKDGSIVAVVGKPTSNHDVPAGIVLRDVRSGEYGPLAIDGYHWVPMGTLTDEQRGLRAGSQMRSQVALSKNNPGGAFHGVPTSGICSEMPVGSNASPMQNMMSVYRVVEQRNGWALIHVNIRSTFIHDNNLWNTTKNKTEGGEADTCSSTPIWGQGQTIGLLDQLAHVEAKDLSKNANKTIGSLTCPPQITHLSLRAGARFYMDPVFRGHIQFRRERVPKGWTRLPLYFDEPTFDNEPGSWVPAIPPEEERKKPVITPTEPSDPNGPNKQPPPPQPPPPPQKQPPAITPGEAAPGPKIGNGSGGVPLEGLAGMLQGLQAQIDGINDILTDVWDAIGYLQTILDEILAKLAALEAASNLGQQKMSGGPPNNGGDGGAAAPGGNSGGGLGGAAPGLDQPPNAGPPAPSNPNGGFHPGGPFVPRGPGQYPPSCAPGDDPFIDDGVCLSTVDPDPFPNAGSGGGESIPGFVGPPGTLILGNPNSFIDADGPAFNVLVDRAGQTWTTVPGMGASLVKLTWDAAGGNYFLDLWQTTYRPVTPASQADNFIASLAGAYGMTLNRHGQITDVGTLGGGTGSASLVSGISLAALPYNVVVGDDGKVIIGNTGPGSNSINLPASAAVADGFTVCIMHTMTDGNTLTIAPNGADTINGVAASYTMAIPGTGYILVSRGTDWVVIGAPTPTSPVMTAANVGTAGTGVFESKSGLTLQLRKINSLKTALTVVLDAPNTKIDLSFNEFDSEIYAAQAALGR